MILTVTPNPTIDRAVFVRDFELGAVVRAEREMVTPSGKGVDASLVIHDLGGDTVALGLNAGLNGRLHEGLMEVWGVPHDFVLACGETRMAIVLIDLACRQQSTISAPTLTATADHLDRLLEMLARHAGRAWGVICGGSLPPGLPVDSYAKLLRQARLLGLMALLDTSGEALRRGIAGLPHILKINRDELAFLDPALARAWHEDADGHLPGRATQADALSVGAHLANGLVARLGEWAEQAIVVTLGGQGALAVTVEGVFFVEPLSVPVVNTAGAGDALDGAVMLALSRGEGWPDALAVGTAAAASVVMNEGTAVCRREQVDEWRARVQVRRLDRF
jgi:1-phosphofructokinase family hexose kinase